MALILSEKDNIQNFINKAIQRHFNPKELDLSKRTRIIADLEKWRDDIVDIWQQKQTGIKSYSVYFDDEFVCRINSNTNPILFEHDFLKGFLELYKTGKIKIKLSDYQEENDVIKQIKYNKKEEKEAEIKRIDKMIEPIEVKETLKKLTEDDYKKTVISDSEIERVKNGTA